VTDQFGNLVEKDSLGRVRYRYIDDEAAQQRENYKRGQVYNYMDGDEASGVVYDYSKTTLVSDKSRVIKGGSWADRAYWLSPGTRRYKEEDQADRTIGFRCAMIRTGAPTGNDAESGFQFKTREKRTQRRY
jgi:hypothetical protein